MKDNEGYCTGCRAETYRFQGETRCESCAGVLRQSDHRKQPVTTEPAENRARMASDGGRVSVPRLGDVRPAYLLAGSLVGFVVFRAVSGGPDPVERSDEDEERDDPAAIEATADGDLYCPECGEAYSPQGMIGHLRWGHDYSTEEMQDALPG